MGNEFSRTELLLGAEAMDKLKNSRVAVFGVGGVGGYVVEALARSGVGELDLIDNDTVSITNINRQIIALHSTMGKLKVDVAAERIRDINPGAIVHRHACFFLPETADQFDFSQYDYVVDAIDTVSGKIEIILRSQAAGVPVISAMGAGNKLNPGMFRVADIFDTKVCPLARAMRGLLKKKGVKKLKVVYSEEEATKPREEIDENGRILPGSLSFVPPVMGLMLAGEVVKDLIKEEKHGA
ncbi:MAG: tRNA threonylcarbamoyladenosine dehydratase [Clostridia bacterium]|nr:tRNA threonylcarbamoyladenosine dehydratase [Clostridia bacterium]MBP3652634.1 tRNA threonylcarbamoyladenosine dehydratase [Clostridia bacterium]